MYKGSEERLRRDSGKELGYLGSSSKSESSGSGGRGEASATALWTAAKVRLNL